MKNIKNKVMFNIILIISTLFVCITTSQWMPFLDPQNMSPFAHPLPHELIGPKDSATKIPIILLLKPKRAKSMRADPGPENVGNYQTSGDHSLSFNDWISLPEFNSDSINSPQKHINEPSLSSKTEAMFEQDPEASEEDEIKVRGRAGEQIKWSSLNGKKNGVTAEQLASISQLFPKLSAMSPSTTDENDMTNKDNSASFEDTLKKFTSNLTDFEHRNNEENAKNIEEMEELDNTSDSTDNPRTGVFEALKSSQTENTNENNDQKSQSVSLSEERTIHHRMNPQKTSPFINERNRIRIPVKSESEKSDLSHETISGRPSNKGWIPINSKQTSKVQQKPSKPVTVKIERNQIHLSTEPTPFDGEYLYQNNDHQMFGRPEPFHTIPSPEPYPKMFRPRHFPHSYIPFDTKHSIKHLPFHTKYSSYLTETELSPTLMSMEMTADANKPQHMEPNKLGEAMAMVDSDGKPKDVIEQKEQMIDNKQVIGEKHIIVGNKHVMHGLEGDELLGQHITCCDLLHNQHNGPQHMINEEVIKTEFDDDKVMPLMAFSGNKFDFPVHFGHQQEHYFPQQFHHKKQCNHRLPSYPTTYWPQHVYRRPVYRPKIFYKPLLFG